MENWWKKNFTTKRQKKNGRLCVAVFAFGVNCNFFSYTRSTQAKTKKNLIEYAHFYLIYCFRWFFVLLLVPVIIVVMYFGYFNVVITIIIVNDHWVSGFFLYPAYVCIVISFFKLFFPVQSPKSINWIEASMTHTQQTIMHMNKNPNAYNVMYCMGRIQ